MFRSSEQTQLTSSSFHIKRRHNLITIVLNKIKQRYSKDLLHFIKHLDVIIYYLISLKIFRRRKVWSNKINV